MKNIFQIFIYLGFGFSISAAFASDKTWVCLPEMNPSAPTVKLQIKASQGTCAANEKLFELQKSEAGIILFLPSDATAPSSQPAAGIPGNPRPAKPYSYY